MLLKGISHQAQQRLKGTAYTQTYTAHTKSKVVSQKPFHTHNQVRACVPSHMCKFSASIPEQPGEQHH